MVFCFFAHHPESLFYTVQMIRNTGHTQGHPGVKGQDTELHLILMGHVFSPSYINIRSCTDCSLNATLVMSQL